MKNKASITEVGMAAYYLQTLKKYEDSFTAYPDTFRLRGTISNEVMEIPLNDVIKQEIKKFFAARKAHNQSIIDNNPKIVEIIEKHENK